MPDAQGNPSLTIKDAIMLRNIDNYKLACLYLDSTFKKNRQRAMEESQKLQQQNQELQQQSAIQSQQQEAALQKEKLAAEKEMLDFKATKEKELATVNGLWQAIGKGVISPNVALPVIQQLIPNITIPLTMENQAMQENIAANQQAEMMQQQQAAQQEGAEQEKGAQQNPQEEAVEQQQGQPQTQQ
jgi:hypothetical protein